MQASRSVLLSLFKNAKTQTRSFGAPGTPESRFPPDSFSNRSIKCGEKPTVLLLFAPGSEEVESLTVVDVLRRGNVKVTIGGVESGEAIKGKTHTAICPDMSIEKAGHSGPYDVVVLPGGIIASKNFSESEKVGQILKAQEKSKGIVGAICAAPVALKHHGVFKGKNVTLYPAMAEEMKQGGEYKFINKPVVIDGRLITSQGPGTAFLFAFTILEKLRGEKTAQQVASDMLYNYKSLKSSN